jgi:hypothetical protein
MHSFALPMQQNRSNIFGWFFTALLALPIALILVLQCCQWYVQHKAKERLEIQSLHTLHIQSKDLVWEKQGKELRIAGRLFDVHSISQSTTGLIIKGLFDEEEMAIENMLATQQAGSNTLIKLLLLTHLTVITLIFLISLFQYSGADRKIFSKTASALCKPFKYLLTPPPRTYFA